MARRRTDEQNPASVSGKSLETVPELKTVFRQPRLNTAHAGSLLQRQILSSPWELSKCLSSTTGPQVFGALRSSQVSIRDSWSHQWEKGRILPKRATVTTTRETRVCISSQRRGCCVPCQPPQLCCKRERSHEPQLPSEVGSNLLPKENENTFFAEDK